MFCFFETVLLCILGWLQVYNLLDSASRVLRLQVCVAILKVKFIKYNLSAVKFSLLGCAIWSLDKVPLYTWGYVPRLLVVSLVVGEFQMFLSSCAQRLR
jgi:hypothetical protein